jgi:carbamoyltransferase
MKVLGISCFFHDSTACLIEDGRIVACGAEERFSRKKHDNTFPEKAIAYCLNEANLAMNEIDKVAFYEKPVVKFERVMSQHLQHAPKSISSFLKHAGSWAKKRLSLKKILERELNYFGEIEFYPHHLSHAATSFYLSNFDQAHIVVLDGVGEWATTTVGHAKGKDISLDQSIHFPHSLGLLYSTLTSYLGFRVNNSEFKVMGLASYGDPSRYDQEYSQLIELKEDSSFELNMDYFQFDWSKQRMYSQQLVDLFGHPPREPETELKQFHQDLAAGLQATLEKAAINLLKSIKDQYPGDKVCLSGGVALNSVLNGKILNQTDFKKIFIPPDPSDGGAALGAALLASKKDWDSFEDFSPYLGPGYNWAQINQVLEQTDGIEYQLYPEKAKLSKKTAQLLDQEKVVALFQGRMEWGPRALGNRSILSSAASVKMRDLLNAKVKHREKFRPFAPVVLKNEVETLFKLEHSLPRSAKWMLMVYPLKEEKHDDIPAVVHVDGSGRLQSLEKEDNPFYYQVLEDYHDLSGVPVLINTSFNVRGEPIVCTPQDAVDCYLGTEIDYLIIGNYLVQKI